MFQFERKKRWEKEHFSTVLGQMKQDLSSTDFCAAQRDFKFYGKISCDHLSVLGGTASTISHSGNKFIELCALD